ncbi:hypothetical protein ACSSS7_005195 [Eimeria intestinalis]
MCSLVRHSDVFDLFDMQHVNFVNLPENYVMKYYFFHALSWPQLPTVAEDGQGKLVGYVLAKLEDENSPVQKPHGHVTSVAVLRQSRKLGLASKLMNLSQRAMQDVFSADFAALHVRVTNRAAYALYSKTLGYRVHDIDKEYYADKEDAFNMRNYFNKEEKKKSAMERNQKGRAARQPPVQQQEQQQQQQQQQQKQQLQGGPQQMQQRHLRLSNKQQQARPQGTQEGRTKAGGRSVEAYGLGFRHPLAAQQRQRKYQKQWQQQQQYNSNTKRTSSSSSIEWQQHAQQQQQQHQVIRKPGTTRDKEA